MKVDREDIDKKKKILRSQLEEHGGFRFDDSIASDWRPACKELADEGFLTMAPGAALEVTRKR